MTTCDSCGWPIESGVMCLDCAAIMDTIDMMTWKDDTPIDPSVLDVGGYSIKRAEATSNFTDRRR